MEYLGGGTLGGDPGLTFCFPFLPPYPTPTPAFIKPEEPLEKATTSSSSLEVGLTLTETCFTLIPAWRKLPAMHVPIKASREVMPQALLSDARKTLRTVSRKCPLAKCRQPPRGLREEAPGPAAPLKCPSYLRPGRKGLWGWTPLAQLLPLKPGPPILPYLPGAYLHPQRGPTLLTPPIPGILFHHPTWPPRMPSDAFLQQGKGNLLSWRRPGVPVLLILGVLLGQQQKTGGPSLQQGRSSLPPRQQNQSFLPHSRPSQHKCPPCRQAAPVHILQLGGKTYLPEERTTPPHPWMIPSIHPPWQETDPPILWQI